MLALAVVGFGALVKSADLRLPFQTLVTFNGSMGAQTHFFEDERVRDLLLRHHMRVDVNRQGSVAAATGDPDSLGLDFVFTSGQYAADVLIKRRDAAPEYHKLYRPFVSSIVLATYRDYAETLSAVGVATPQDTPGFDRPYYYNLNMGAFLGLVRDGRSWNDLNGPAHGVVNGNQVLAQTPDLCESNSGGTYIGMVSYAVHGRAPRDEQEAASFGVEIKPLIDPQGIPLPAPETYFGADGRRNAPISVLYEHQYLARQLDHLERSGELDGDRVLLYPDTASQTYPLFVALNENADRLGRLLITDQELRGRAVERGFGVISLNGAYGAELPQYLAERRVPEPPSGNDTKAVLPAVPLLTKMFSVFCGGPT